MIKSRQCEHGAILNYLKKDMANIKKTNKNFIIGYFFIGRSERGGGLRGL